MKGINVERVRKVIREGLKSEVVLFFLLISVKLLLFNEITEGGSLGNIALIASVAGTVLVLVCWTILLRRALRLPILYIIDCGVTFIIVADMLFYRYFSDVLSMPLITQVSVVSSVKSSIFNLIHVTDMFFILDLVVILFMYFAGRLTRAGKSSSYGRHVIRFAFALVIGLGLSSYGVSVLLKSQPDIFKSFYDRVYIVQNVGLLSFHSIDAFKFIQARDESAPPVTEEQKQEIKGFLDEKKNGAKEPPVLFGAGKGKNLIVVQVEALQEFVINKSINGQEITPNLNKLIKRSMYFNNYYSETAGGGTSDAELLSNVSMFPAKDGSAYIRFSGNDYYSIAKRLKEEGYGTSAMHAYKPGFWNRSIMYQTLGFDEFVNKDDYQNDEIIGMGLSDKSFLRQSLERLEKYKEPYYSLLITLTSHFPYDNDKKYYGSFDVGKYKDTFLGNYLEAIHYTDEALGEFIGGLESSGLMEGSVLAVYGDHHAIPKDKKEYLTDFLELKVMDEFNWVKLQKVPLIIHLPGDGNAGIKSIAGGGVDFMPTVMNIMGIDTSSVPMLGRDLLNSPGGMAILRHGTFITDKYMCLVSEGEVYDLETGERHPVGTVAEEKELAMKHLEYSDLIMENNLTKELIEYLKTK
ncbi:MAG TPA: LTA synthase family protein [Clostridia bacterium]|nr:LTA synthase family protein [Clostridia bacterium]